MNPNRILWREDTIMAIERTHPSSLGQPGGYHHVVKDGKTVYLAGQVARDRDGNTVGVGDAAAQATV